MSTEEQRKADSIKLGQLHTLTLIVMHAQEAMRAICSRDEAFGAARSASQIVTLTESNSQPEAAALNMAGNQLQAQADAQIGALLKQASQLSQVMAFARMPKTAAN